MPFLSLAKLLALLAFAVLTYWEAKAEAVRCEAVFAPRRSIIEPEMTPMESTLAQMEARFVRVEQLLRMTSPQRQRQAQKIMRQLRKIVEEFARTGEMSDASLAKFMELTEKLELLEQRMAEVEVGRNMDPFDLARYLHTLEPIKPGIEYTADLPGFGVMRIEFSKEVAELFSKKGTYRDLIFPFIFNGLVGKKARDGIKDMGVTTPANIKIVDGIEYRLMELKSVGKSESRVLIIYSSEGILHFHKYINNHNRVDYIAREDIIGSFLNSRR